MLDEKYLLTLLAKSADTLNKTESRVLEHLRRKEPISRNINDELAEKLTFGQRVADRVASFGGSWPFIGIFTVVLIIWIGMNSLILLFHAKPFDPYPFILLNLFLSMLAAIQAPVIMMSQNRHAERDRLDAQHDYEVNLKAELEIHSLHEKIDALKSELEIEELHVKIEALRQEIIAFREAITKQV
ncbi:MAG: DUF1003 domain-containing protein [Candidatus Cloacimonas sp.]|jgi:uncharacterized membrane protein|nr:DUF1003 domain-containing protein [Candidatus Cloacimonas sp.]